MNELSPRRADSLELGATGPHVGEFQRALNRIANRYRRNLVLEDEYLGPLTARLYSEVMWALGVTELEKVSLPVVPRHLEIVLGKKGRHHYEILRGRVRRRHLGPEITGADVMAGVRLLRLVGDWESWVYRRVETVAFSEDDRAVFTRKRSIDFSVAPFLPPNHEDDAPMPVPLTFMRKWALPAFDLRDEGGRSLPLLARDEQARLTTGMLVALAYRVVEDVVPPENTTIIPEAIERDLRVIVNDEPAVALGVLSELGATKDVSGTEARWRHDLVRSEAFMELATELARGFLAIVQCPPPLKVRRVIKLSYEWSTTEPPRRSARERMRGWRDLFRDSASSSLWLAPGEARPAAYGRLVLELGVEKKTVGSRPSGDDDPACLDVVVKAENGRRQVIRLRPYETYIVENLPPGRYRVTASAPRGFHFEKGSADQEVGIGEGDDRVQQLQFHLGQHRVLQPRAARGPRLPRERLGRRLTRAIGWRSKSLMIRLRVADGGSFHCEFEAPTGLQITRAKLVTDARGEVDIVLRSRQRVHLYAPGAQVGASDAHALFNLRPRPDTLVRSAVLSGMFAASAVFALALRWAIEGAPGPNALALLLAVPGGLAAYVAQSLPNRVTGGLLLGLRVLASVPGVLVFIAAAVFVTARDRVWGMVVLWVIVGLLILITTALQITHWFSMRPIEQRVTEHAQSPLFTERYL